MLQRKAKVMSDRMPARRSGDHRTGAVVALDIEVTPEMIEAGVDEFALFDFGDRGEWIVTAVYRAMARVAGLTKIGAGDTIGTSSVAE